MDVPPFFGSKHCIDALYLCMFEWAYIKDLHSITVLAHIWPRRICEWARRAADTELLPIHHLWSSCSHQHRSITETGSSFHSIIPATRTRDICLLWKCLLPPSLHVTIKEKEGCCARARSVTKSYYYESCSKPLTSFYLSLCSVQSYSSTGKPMKLFLPGRGVACMLRLIMF